MKWDSTGSRKSIRARRYFRSDLLRKLEGSIRPLQLCTEGREEYLESLIQAKVACPIQWFSSLAEEASFQL